MRAFTLVAVLATARASEDCEVIDLPGSLKLDFSISSLPPTVWAEPSVWVVLGLLLLCCFLCLLCLLFWLCCGKPGKEKLYVYQVPDLPMKQVEVAFRA